DICEGAQVDAVGFTTEDATLVTKIAYILFHDVSLYAETNAGLVGVAKSVDGVSWTEDTATAPTGEQPIRLFDEHGYAALKKAQRSGEDSSAVKPIATVKLYHPEPTESRVQSETIAIIAIIILYYYAYSQKSIIMAKP
ncbi:Translocon-associated protein subunit delta, partial [Armadillidium vulgare]